MDELKSTKILLSATIDKNLKNKFKISCAKIGKYQNEVLEELISEFIKKVGEGEDGNTNKRE